MKFLDVIHNGLLSIYSLVKIDTKILRPHSRMSIPLHNEIQWLVYLKYKYVNKCFMFTESRVVYGDRDVRVVARPPQHGPGPRVTRAHAEPARVRCISQVSAANY